MKLGDALREKLKNNLNRYINYKKWHRKIDLSGETYIFEDNTIKFDNIQSNKEEHKEDVSLNVNEIDEVASTI